VATKTGLSHFRPCFEILLKDFVLGMVCGVPVFFFLYFFSRRFPSGCCFIGVYKGRPHDPGDEQRRKEKQNEHEHWTFHILPPALLL
jgi:hypothetical protein